MKEEQERESEVLFSEMSQQHKIYQNKNLQSLYQKKQQVAVLQKYKEAECRLVQNYLRTHFNIGDGHSLDSLARAPHLRKQYALLHQVQHQAHSLGISLFQHHSYAREPADPAHTHLIDKVAELAQGPQEALQVEQLIKATGHFPFIEQDHEDHPYYRFRSLERVYGRSEFMYQDKAYYAPYQLKQEDQQQPLDQDSLQECSSIIKTTRADRQSVGQLMVFILEHPHNVAHILLMLLLQLDQWLTHKQHNLLFYVLHDLVHNLANRHQHLFDLPQQRIKHFIIIFLPLFLEKVRGSAVGSACLDEIKAMLQQWQTNGFLQPQLAEGSLYLLSRYKSDRFRMEHGQVVLEETKDLRGLRLKEFYRQLECLDYLQLEGLTKILGLVAHKQKSSLLGQLLGLIDQQMEHQDFTVDKEFLAEKIDLDLGSAEDLQIIQQLIQKYNDLEHTPVAAMTDLHQIQEDTDCLNILLKIMVQRHEQISDDIDGKHLDNLDFSLYQGLILKIEEEQQQIYDNRLRLKEKWEGVLLSEEEISTIETLIRQKDLSRLVINADYYQFMQQVQELKERRKHRNRRRSRSRSRSKKKKNNYRY